MQIVINDNSIITAYATTGKLHGGVDFYGNFPADFVPEKYRWNKIDDIDDESPTYIFREIEIDEKITDENGEEIPYKVTKLVREVGEVALNPEYSPTPEQPVVTEEQRISALEDATAEIIELLLGGE